MGCDGDPAGSGPNLRLGTNIKSMAAVSATKAYITQWQSAELVVVNPTDGTVTGSIDLSAYKTYAGSDSAEPYPYMDVVKVYGDKAYVACQRLRMVDGGTYTSWVPADTSLIVVIDVNTDAVLDAIRLQGKNPTAMEAIGSRLFVACAGNFYVDDGCIEAVDLTSDSSLGTVVTEAALGGDIEKLTVVAASKAYVTVMPQSATSYANQLVEFNPTTGAVVGPVPRIGNAFGGAVYDGNLLYVADQSTTKPGIMVVDPATDTIVAGPFDVGMIPSGLTICGEYLVATTRDEGYAEANVGILSLTDTTQRYPNLLANGIATDNGITSFNGQVFVLERGSQQGMPNRLIAASVDQLRAGTVQYQSNLSN
jgi:glutamine cyclotransferase